MITNSAQRDAQAEHLLTAAIMPAIEALLAGQHVKPDQAQLSAILTEAKGRLRQLPAPQLATASSAGVVSPIALESAQRVLGDLGPAAVQQTALRAFQAGALASIPQYILDRLDMATRQAIGLADRSGANSAASRSGSATTSAYPANDGYAGGRYLGSERYTSLSSSVSGAYSPTYIQIATGLSPGVYHSISGHTPGQVYNAALDARNIFNGTSTIGGWSSGWSAGRSDIARQRFVDEVTPKLLDASRSARQEITRVFSDKSGKEKIDMSKITKSNDIDAAFGVVLADAKARSKDGKVDTKREAEIIEKRFGEKYLDVYQAWQAGQLKGEALENALQSFTKANNPAEIAKAKEDLQKAIAKTPAAERLQTHEKASELSAALLPRESALPPTPATPAKSSEPASSKSLPAASTPPTSTALSAPASPTASPEPKRPPASSAAPAPR